MTISTRIALLSASSLIAVVAVSSSAFAQAVVPAPDAPAAAPASASTPAPAPAPAPAPGPAAQPAAPAASAETVVVTGSRLARSSFTSASPITVIKTENSVLSGDINITEALQTSVAASGSGQINNSFAGFITEGGPGVNTIGLRGLGPGRTLVLLNGRRLPPAGVQGQTGLVDLNTLPSLALDRTEVLRDGASTTYGSDAIGGVVNVISRKRVNGFEVEGSASLPVEGGGEFYQGGFVWGQTKERYNFLITGQYEQQMRLQAKDRDFAKCRQDYVFNPATGGRADFIDQRTNTFFCRGTAQANVAIPAGTVWLADATVTERTVGVRADATPISGSSTVCLNAGGFQVGCNAVLTVPGFRRVFGPKIGTVGLPLGLQLEQQTEGDDQTDIYSPVQRTNVFGAGAMDIDAFGGAELFGEFLFSRRESQQRTSGNTLIDLPVSFQGNPWVSVYGNAANVTILPIINYVSDQDVSVWQVVAGIRGSTFNGLGGFLRNGKWELSAQTSESNGTYTATNILKDRFDASTVQTIVNGVATCPAPTISGGTCLAVPWLSSRIVGGTFNDQEKAYLIEQTENSTVYKQSVVEGFVSGEVAKLPAGNLVASVGFQYRTYSILDTPGKNAQIYNTQSGGVGITKGDDSVLEAYGEVEFPVVRGKPLFEDLTLNLQGRYTNYDSYGSDTVYKANVNWQVTPEVRVRGGIGQSFRAPQLYEQWLNRQEGFLQLNADPCLNWAENNNQIVRTRCAAAGVPNDLFPESSPSSLSTGGRLTGSNLTAETAENHGFGLVYRPTFADLQIALDYSSVEISNGIARFGGGNTLALCYVVADPQFQPLCNNVKRDPVSKQLLAVDNDFRNISSQSQRELSLNIDYSVDFAFGTLSIASETTLQLEAEAQLFNLLDSISSLGETGFPELTSRTQFQFSRKDWLYTWTVRSIGATDEAEDFAEDYGGNPTGFANAYSGNGVPVALYKTRAEATTYHSASVRYRSDKWTVIGGIDNLFDEKPPSLSRGPDGEYFNRLGTAVASSQYDLQGRTVFMQFGRRF